MGPWISDGMKRTAYHMEILYSNMGMVMDGPLHLPIWEEGEDMFTLCRIVILSTLWTIVFEIEE